MQCRVADAVALTPLYLRRTRVRRRTAPARRPARARARYAREHTPSRRTFVVPAAECTKTESLNRRSAVRNYNFLGKSIP